MNYKVLHVIDKLSVGGAERVLIDQVNLLRKKGISVAVATLVDRGELFEYLNNEIPYFNLKRCRKLDFVAAIRLHALCNQFDLIHVHLRYNFRYVSLVKFLCQGKYKVIHHDHFGDIEKDTQVPFGIKFFSKLNPYFIGVSKQLIEWAYEKLNLEPKTVWLLPNIVVRNSKPLPRTKSNDKVRFLIVSNFRASKNLTFAIELIEALKMKLDFHVDLIGQISDLNYYNSVLDLIAQKKLQQILEIKTTVKSIQSTLASYDLAIHTADQESGPLVFIEYLGHHLPFVAFKTGEVSTQLSISFPEFFMSDFELNHWTERIVAVLKQGNDQEEKMESVYNTLYSGDSYCNSTIAIYESILTGNL